MNLRILFLFAAIATLALALNTDHLVISQFGVVPFKYGCKYRVSTVWNDIFFLVDRSGSYGDFSQLFYTMTKIVAPFQLSKIGSIKEYNVRAGVAFFNSKVSLVAPFGQTLKSDISAINTLSYFDDEDKTANIDLALQNAEIQLDKSDRPLSKKVIVLLTTQTSYNSTYAAQLKKKGIIINVYNLQNAAAPSNLLSMQQLASPGFATDSIKHRVDDLQRLQATANCFCDPQLQSFTNDNTTGVPTGGCYGVPKPSYSYVSAKSFCYNNYNGGIITLDENQQKADFLDKVNNYTVGSAFYIGLKWTDEFTEPVWMWEDGTTSDDTDFNLFTTGKVPVGTSDLGCVVQLAGKKQWQTVSCKTLYRYVCETAPCDSTNYYCTPNV